MDILVSVGSDLTFASGRQFNKSPSANAETKSIKNANSCKNATVDH